MGLALAANVMHAMVATTTPAAWIGAAFWPIALLLAVEVITRVDWPQRHPLRHSPHGGTGLVAIVAAIVSYRHMTGLLTTWGEDPPSPPTSAHSPSTGSWSSPASHSSPCQNHAAGSVTSSTATITPDTTGVPGGGRRSQQQHTRPLHRRSAGLGRAT